LNLKNTKNPLFLILVEPSGSINLGSVARLCENFEVDELRLVSPLCSPHDPIAKKMAIKGKHYLEKAIIFTSLLDALNDCQKVIATCGRIDHGSIPLSTPEEALPWFVDNSTSGPVAIIFGREDRGLTNEELLLAQKVITINSSSKYPSLNLSHAVGMTLYELNKNQIKLNSNLKVESKELATPKQLNDLMIDTQDLLIDIGFLLKHTAKARMTKIKSLLNRSEIRSKEISLLRGILRQTRWAINASQKYK
tara:strand:+ start:542 stop:1294 length:753 start_codon:yes stop_codon:yes gene_type:complete